MDILMVSLIGISLLVAIQVSVGVENTNHQQQFIIINQHSPDTSDDSGWVVALIITLGVAGLAYLLMS
jgi:hypothetical protein